MTSHFDYLPPEYRNPLTDLPNSLAIKERLYEATLQTPGRFGLLKLDLDSFKEINDQDGHADGDEYIRTTGDVLGHILREGDLYLPAHDSGDEFSVMIYDITMNEHVTIVQERIHRTLDSYGIEVSIGGRMHVLGETAEELAEAADALMYKNKAERKIAKYDNPEARRAIHEIGRLALAHNIAPRDIPALIQLMKEGLY